MYLFLIESSLARVPSVDDISTSLVMKRSSMGSKSSDHGSGSVAIHSGVWYTITVVAGLVILSAAAAMCVKSAQNNTK